MTVAIITDTVACLPAEFVEKYRITVVPLEIIHEGKVYRDGIDITPAQFYQLLADSNVLPSTSAPAPAVYLEIYKKMHAQGRDIMVVCPSTKLTHVYGSASIAASMLKEEMPAASIMVLDTGTAAGAQGLIAMDMAENAIQGKDLNAIHQIAQEAMKLAHVLVAIDTLKYLARSGRVPNLFAIANEVIKIKPVIELLPGGKGVVGTGGARNIQKAIDKIINIVKNRIKGLPVRVVVQHTNAQDNAAILENKVRAQLNCSQVFVKDFTAVMGVHTGPGLVGLSYSTYDASRIEK
jgi:DegV family protein with EDD domain